ncbi:hypothetical protein CEXT_456991 [Caerostris extrusa]|uniref:Uncharacterized protein n=1 Tax=Caerostris extrusa TaxID=172846 RepID=A0AAV4MKS3_CAEEX|nr:hypothetical protein CEXT_456991 [Caerostris extrusa]
MHIYVQLLDIRTGLRKDCLKFPPLKGETSDVTCVMHMYICPVDFRNRSCDRREVHPPSKKGWRWPKTTTTAERNKRDHAAMGPRTLRCAGKRKGRRSS